MTHTERGKDPVRHDKGTNRTSRSRRFRRHTLGRTAYLFRFGYYYYLFHICRYHPEERPASRFPSFGSDLLYGYGEFVLIYCFILNKFESDRCGYGEFVLIYHSILNTFGSDRIFSGSFRLKGTSSSSTIFIIWFIYFNRTILIAMLNNGRFISLGRQMVLPMPMVLLHGGSSWVPGWDRPVPSLENRRLNKKSIEDIIIIYFHIDYNTRRTRRKQRRQCRHPIAN